MNPGEQRFVAEVDGEAADLNAQRRQEAHEKIVTSIEHYAVIILTSTDIPAARRGALVARLGKLTVQAAGTAPMPGIAEAGLRRMAAYGDEVGYPDDYPGMPLMNAPGDLGNIQRQTIAALGEMQKPKEVDKARTLEALIASRDSLSRDYDLSRDPTRAALVSKLDSKIERLIDDIAPDPAPTTTGAGPDVENGPRPEPLDIPDYEGD